MRKITVRYDELLEHDLLTAQEVADYMRVDIRTVREWVSSGSLPRVMVGKRDYRILRNDLEKFIRERRQAGRQEDQEA